jgi:hypothetical protein
MATLTLHQGTAEQVYAEHPIEIARRALREAAEAEGPDWASIMLRVASALPERGPIMKKGE